MSSSTLINDVAGACCRCHESLGRKILRSHHFRRRKQLEKESTESDSWDSLGTSNPAENVCAGEYLSMAPFAFRAVKREFCRKYGGLGFALQRNSPPLKGISSPSCSSRYLLDGEDDDGLFFDAVEDLVPQLTRIKSTRFQIVTGEDSAVLTPSPYSAQRAKIHNVALDASSSSLPPTRFVNTRVKARDDQEGIKSPIRESFLRRSASSSENRAISPVGLAASSSSREQDKVVVLRVSLHCKACESKVKKHLSRLEGVRSFDVDFATKKVTVVGDVTPLSLLSSVSKVKNAQLWSSSSSSLALV